MERLGDMLAMILGTPRAMKPEELEERVESLELRVESNKLALERHERDRQAHQQGEGRSDQC